MVLEDPCERVIQSPTQVSNPQVENLGLRKFPAGRGICTSQDSKKSLHSNGSSEVEETSLLYRVVCKIAARCGALRGLWRDLH